MRIVRSAALLMLSYEFRLNHCNGKPEAQMMKLTIALIFASLSTTAVYAEIYNYLCRVDGKMYPLRVDDNENVLEWRGKTYSLTIASADEPDGCAKYGWHAKGNGTSFNFCTATQGYAAIEDKDGNDQVQCNLKRMK